MAAAQAVYVRASLLFMGDLNDHHQEWLGSTTNNHHGLGGCCSTTWLFGSFITLDSHFDGTGYSKLVC